MILVGIFLINAALSFGLSLLLALLLGPDGFGRYALALALTVVINTVFFEWLRLSATRWYSERARTEEPAVRATLDRTYVAAALALVAATVAAVGLGLDGGLTAPLLVAAAACGLTYGLCEYGMALARARFLQRPYALLVLGRGVAGFALATAAALLSGDPALVLGASAAAAAIVTVLSARSLADVRTEARPRGVLLARFASYAVPLVVATALYQVMPVANRAILAGREGFEAAGYLSLASEIATRLFQNLGSALDLVLFQLAVRAEERYGCAEADRQVTRNAGIVLAAAVPAAFGLWLVWPAFEAIFVPPAFRGAMSGPMSLLIPALCAFALIQYALNPTFQIRRRTAAVVAAAAVALATDLGIVLLWPGLSGPTGFAAAQLAGLAAGLVTVAGFALWSGARLPWRDLGLSLAATAAMGAALWPTREMALAPAATLIVQVTLGAAVYAAAAFALDLAGVRRAILGRCRDRRELPSTA